MLNKFGRIVACGAISGYNSAPAPIHNYTNVVVKSLEYVGFIVGNYVAKFPEGIAKLGEWLQAGQIKYRHFITNGLENFPDACNQMFSGANIGKVLCRISEQ